MNKTMGADGVVVAAAAVDRDRTLVETIPAETAADRRFEIGSVTKTMTATVLALMAGEGVLRLEDEIGRWLSAGDSGAITVGQLATHTSGLPGLAPNVHGRGADPGNPWAGYGFEQAEEGLRQIVPSPAAGRPWQYSNLGYQLLGLILERAGGRAFQELLTERLFDPLAMTNSRVGAGDDGLLLQGHSVQGKVGSWDHPMGAGGVEATIEDLARYARACLFPPATPLGTAITRAQTPVLRIGDDTDQALAWTVRGGTVREHSGGTGGFTACVSVDPVRGRAVALLAGYGGSPARASQLKQAALLALAGQDPREAQLPRPYPAWREHVLAMVRALLAGDFPHVHAHLAPPRREKTTARHLERAWTSKTREAGTAQDRDIAVVREEIAVSGAVVADVEIGFDKGPQRLRMVVLPDGDLGGFTFLPPAA